MINFKEVSLAELSVTKNLTKNLKKNYSQRSTVRILGVCLVAILSDGIEFRNAVFLINMPYL